MPESRPSRFPPESAAYERRGRLPCFTRFFGESVSDALGVVQSAPSATKCQDCPDTDICFRLTVLRRLELAAAEQRALIERLDGLIS
ncbi:hypothetical protein LLH00_17085 [bacterium]|nr:hypothetical protein [bacterium]